MKRLKEMGLSHTILEYFGRFYSLEMFFELVMVIYGLKNIQVLFKQNTQYQRQSRNKIYFGFCQIRKYDCTGRVQFYGL